MGRSPDELQKLWLSSLKHERRASPNTLRAYGDDLSRFLGFLHIHLGSTINERALAKVAPADIRAFITDRRSDGLGARDAALLTLLYGAGLRISEALSLKRGDVPLAETLTILGKGRKERVVPVLPLLKEAIGDYAAKIPFTGAPSAPLFLSRRGKPMSAREAQGLMQKLRGRLGLTERATPHALRHSFATHLLQGGGDLRSVQELLGHASLSTTQTYTAIDMRQLMETYQSAHPRGKIQ